MLLFTAKKDTVKGKPNYQLPSLRNTTIDTKCLPLSYTLHGKRDILM